MGIPISLTCWFRSLHYFQWIIENKLVKKGIEIKEICCKQTSKRKESVNVIFACKSKRFIDRIASKSDNRFFIIVM